MTESLRQRLLALTAFVAVVALASCDSNPTEEPTADSGTDATDTAGDAATPDATPDALDPDAPPSDAGVDATDVDSTDDSRPDATEDGGETGCVIATDCPARFDCVEGECLRRCVQSSECDDLNVCTSNACVDGHCIATVLDPPPIIGDPIPGDCRRDVCLDGELGTFPDREDIPEDDGVFCTVEQCRGAFPFHDPEDALCDDGIPENGAEVCSAAARGCILGGRPDWFCEPLLPEWEPTETCGDGQDNDGDGLADEGCPCEFGAVQRCYTGPPSSRDIGGCLDGYQQCTNRRDPAWGDCEGQIVPQEEICDLKDNDCNDCVDDIEECDPLLSCPTEDFARPLRDYPLDASAIFDLDGAVVEGVTWRVIAPANSATTAVDDADAITTSLYLDVSGDYQVSLELDTDKGVFGCSWVVHVAGSGLRVEMRWDTFGSVDMDLHLHRSGSTRGFCTDDDCYYANCTTGGFGGGPSWGYPSSPPSECDGTGTPCNNPRLDIDNIRGYDPENINIDNPNDGDTFRVMAHKYSGSPATNPVLSLYCGGRLRAVLGETPDEARLTQAGGGCGGNTWRVADVTMIVDADTGVTDCSVAVLSGPGGGWDIRTGTGAY